MKSLEKKIRPPAFARFRGNNALICKTNRFALTGGNLEVGYRSCDWKGLTFYLAGSPYFFKRGNRNTRLGGLGKFRVTYKNVLSAEISVFGDHINRAEVNGTIRLTIPLGKKAMRCTKNPVNCCDRFRPPERFEPIVFEKSHQQVIATDSGGNPLNFTFVNNLSSSSGTFESPFPTLMQAQNQSKAGDFIYVFAGDGTSTGMSDGFTMKSSQTLAGSGTELLIATQFGQIAIPAQTTMRPILSNSNGNGVTLANNCTVNGIDVVEAQVFGFYYEPVDGVSTATFNHCSAINNGGGFFIDDMPMSNDSIFTGSFAHCAAINSTVSGGFTVNQSGKESSFIISFANCSAIGNVNNGDMPFNASGGFGIHNGASDPNNRNSCTVSFRNCLASDNENSDGTSVARGGFALNNQGSGLGSNSLAVSFENCSAIGNSTSMGVGTSGGIVIRNGDNAIVTASFMNCLASDNTSSTTASTPTGGFAIDNVEGIVVCSFTNCSAINNSNSGGNFNGGFAAASSPGSPTDSFSALLTNCLSKGNTPMSFDIESADDPRAMVQIEEDATLSVDL
ncbi:MAG: hypothetical protein AAF443_06570 [Chlamydiota bacterium]